MIHLEPITVDNWRTRLAVSEAQREYVANSTVLLARAYAYRDMGSYACMIFNDDTPVGMALYYDCPELGEYVLSQLFIDERYQGRGYGRAATTLSALFRYSPDCLFCGNAATVPPAARPHKLHIPRPAASGRSRPFRCSSSPNCKRFAGLQFGSICLARKSRQKDALETRYIAR